MKNNLDKYKLTYDMALKMAAEKSPEKIYYVLDNGDRTGRILVLSFDETSKPSQDKIRFCWRNLDSGEGGHVIWGIKEWALPEGDAGYLNCLHAWGVITLTAHSGEPSISSAALIDRVPL